MHLINPKYAFLAAFTKGQESRIVDTRQIEEILQRSGIHEAVDAIKGTDIGTYLAGETIKTFNDIEESLWKYLNKSIEQLAEFRLPHGISQLLYIYINKYDILNIKTALRTILTETASSMIPIGNLYTRNCLTDLANSRNYEEAGEVLIKGGLADYASIVQSIKEGDPNDLLHSESKLDVMYYENLSSVMQKVPDNRLLLKSFGIIIDFKNLQIILRAGGDNAENAKNLLLLNGGYLFTIEMLQEMIPLKLNEIVARLEPTIYYRPLYALAKKYEKNGTLSTIDTVLELHKIRLLHDLLSPRTLSSVTVFWFIIIKELEVRNVRLMFKSLANNLSPSDIKEYLIRL